MDEPAAPPSKVRRVASDETWPYIETTTKQCLNCTNRESHFHGHECHHVTCTLCKIAYGYKCRSSGPTNLTARGKEERCECGYWHNFCERLEVDHTSRYLQTIPYPPRRSMRVARSARTAAQMSRAPLATAVAAFTPGHIHRGWAPTGAGHPAR
jgi:hypothetical protein